jgi:hypothetical protein
VTRFISLTPTHPPTHPHSLRSAGGESRLVVPPLGTLPIPFLFSPSALGAVQGELRVTTPAPAGSGADAPLRWAFPFSATGEAPVGGGTLQLRAEAKRPTTLPLELPLAGYAGGLGGGGGGWTVALRVLEVVSDAPPASLLGGGAEGEGEGGGGGGGGAAAGSARAAARSMEAGASLSLSEPSLAAAVQHGDGGGGEAHPAAAAAAAAALLASAATFTVRGVVAAGGGGGGGAALSVEAALAPRRPLNARVELVVGGPGGGCWRFPARVAFAPPAPEGTLLLEAPALRAAAAATVQLANHAPARARFVASLSRDTPAAFRVAGQPAGVLPASTAAAILKGTGLAGERGATAAPITVEFTPSEYGTAYGGRLVVDTRDAQWVWRLQGAVREAHAPQGVVSSIDDHLSADARRALNAAHTATARRSARK